ncbi:MAG: glycosyltransferase family 4 protein [Flavihumibacter sp.]|nr:glycosyltransferase family 4 protein [Flavihumibacter sp.]
MHIAFCTDGIYPLMTGGMQKHSRLLVEALSVYEDLTITVLHPHSETIFHSPRIKEIQLSPINTNRNYLIESYRYSQRVADRLNDIQPDIIYSQGLSVWAGIKNFSSRLIINPHGLEPYQAIGLKNKLLALPFKVIFSHLFKQAARIVSLGGKLTGILGRHVANERKLVILPNAINLVTASTSFQRIPSLPVKVLFLARFATNKGIDVLFEAIQQLNKAGYADTFRFVLGGKGPLYEQYHSQPQPENVKLLGFVKDEEIDTLYQENELFILPTLFEGMPTVVLEAMSWKMPIIVSDVGATAEQVDACNGYLVRPGKVEDLVQSLLSYANASTEIKNALGEASYSRVKDQFTWQAVAARHRDLFYTLYNENQ